MNLPSRRLTPASRTSRSPWGGSFAARPPKGGGKPATPAPKGPAPAKAAKPASPAKPAAGKKAGKPTPPSIPRPPYARVEPPTSDELVGAVHVRRMSRGRKPPIIPISPVLPPPPPAPPDFRGAAPTMHYGEAPIPPEKRAKAGVPRSTAAKAAEAARNAVWAVSSEKTTLQIAAAKGAFEAALTEHTESKAAKAEVTKAAKAEVTKAGKSDGKTPAPAPVADQAEAAPRRKAGGKDRWGFFRDELARDSDEDDPHEPWRRDTATPRHEMFDAATEETLAQVEKTLKIQLPPSYRDFNLSWGGGRLFTQEWRQIRLVGSMDIRARASREALRPDAPALPAARRSRRRRLPRLRHVQAERQG